MKDALSRAAARLRTKLHPRRISKAIGAALGGVTGVTVTQVAAEWFDWDIQEPYAGAIAVAVTALGAYIAPANREL
ncbi:hypothetical protein G1H11_14095 [Phytoactinopolyspora alkaliphila]|uniref:Holin n=1 Tax=Phytoactinopolyspora alkaliphila TaxID=1783498 RepID=A0A6N9YNB3_9ACTN|nr:hypothetical protein [Phytoactinopolyspora alkaliphila]NED96437.1 hypothetical protein [Phytoactinopolyspora alkaliphila]